MSAVYQGLPDDWDWTAALAWCLREARRHTACEADAEDAAQAAVMQAWRRQASLRRRESAMAWLLAIARNEALRTHSGRPAVVAEVGTGSLEPCSEGHAEAAARRVDLQRALRELPDADRALALLRYQLDLTQQQAAEVLGLPEGTAKVRLHRLRRKLRGVLQEESPCPSRSNQALPPAPARRTPAS